MTTSWHSIQTAGLLVVVALLAALQPASAQVATGVKSGRPLTTGSGPSPHHYVDPNGDDNGSGTIADPWGTVRHAIEQLVPGDILYLRGGTYYEREIPVEVSGNRFAPITIRSYPGEVAIVDGGYTEFRDVNNTDWELVDAAKLIYRSVNTYPGAGRVYGYFGPQDGGWRLVPYEEGDPFNTDNEDFDDQPPYYYIGPGVFWNPEDLHIYYRSKQSKYQIADGYDVPANPDPGQTPLFIFPDEEVFDIDGATHHVVFQDLVIRHQSSALEIETGAHHITVKDCDLLGGRWHVLVRDGTSDLTFDGVEISDRFPPWVAWSDVKLPSVGRPGRLLQGSGIELGNDADRITIRNCQLTGLFDCIGADGTANNLRVHDNVFDAADDVLQLGSAASRVDFSNNVTLKAHSGGPAWDGSGEQSPAPGTIYIHHNIIDTSTPQRFGRSDPLGLLDDKYDGPLGDGFAAGRPFGSHDLSTVVGPAPWKIYHNTCVFMDDANNGGAGHCYRIVEFDPALPHQVFNNIFVQLGNQWIVRDCRTADGSQVHDGNLYWAPNRDPTMDLMEDVLDVWAGTKLDYTALGAFVGSTSWLSTLAYYPPGWETGGVEADPLLDASYRPDASGPAASGAVDLTGKDWPGLQGETFRGALAPATPP